MQNRFLENLNIKILIISLSIFFFKWFFSYYVYGAENIFIKFLLNPSGDYSYYPFVHQLSELKFNEGYSKLYSDLNVIGFPFLVALFHAIFFKIFHFYGFIILELFCIFFFIKIFYHLFKELNFSDEICLLISLFLFTLPNLINILNTLPIPYIFNLKQLYAGFYNLRFPRPLITNLFFFSFLLFLIKFYLNRKPELNKTYLYLSLIFLGALLNSFFYFFIISLILIFLIILFKLKKNLFNKENLILLLNSNIILLIVSLPFLLQILNIEEDYFSRIGTFSLNNNNKIFLANHLLSGFLKIEFLFILVANIAMYFVNIKLNSNYKKFINFFWLLFLSSVLAPIIYLLIMDKITFFGNFTFIIALSSIILLKFNIILLLITCINLKKNSNNSISSAIIIFLILLNSVFFFQNSKVNLLSEGEHFNVNNSKIFRQDLLNVTKYLRQNSEKYNLLLTNDVHTQLWWIFSDRKNYYFPYVFFVSLNDQMIETQLINAFKYLKLNENDFINYFDENKITDWRVVNTNNYFFLGHLKYQANYLTKFFDIDNFPESTKKFIYKKSIHHTNQVILSKNEIRRLKEKFNQTDVSLELEPDIIVLAKDYRLDKNINKIKNFSINFENTNFVILKKND